MKIFEDEHQAPKFYAPAKPNITKIYEDLHKVLILYIGKPVALITENSDIRGILDCISFNPNRPTNLMIGIGGSAKLRPIQDEIAVELFNKDHWFVAKPAI